MKKGGVKIYTTIFLLAFFVLLFFDSSYANGISNVDSNDSKTVRIGFSHHIGFNEINNEGKLYGYSYELVENMRIFNNWDVEYVGYDLGWSDMFDLLDSGEIDLLLNASASEERVDKYLYSELPIYSTGCYLFSDIAATHYSDENYLKYKNLRIGFLKNDYTYELFNEYAKEKNFSYIPVFYRTEDELHHALTEDKEIDLLGYMGKRPVNGEIYVGSFASDNGYIITSKDNTTLMNEVNDSLENLLIVNPNILNELSDKYLNDSGVKPSLFSFKEDQLIESLKNEEIIVLLSGNLEPMSYMEDGQIRGILPDYISLISEVSGLNLKPVFVNCRDNYFEAFDKYNAYIRADAINDFNAAHFYDYQLTIPYIKIPMGKITRVDRNNYGGVSGFLYSPDSDEALKTVTDDRYDFGYENINDAIAALINGEIDYFYAPSFVCQYFCNNNSYPIEYETLDSTFDLCFAVKNDKNALISSILTKSISQISENDVREIFASNFDIEGNTFSFKDAIQKSPWVIYAITVFILITVSFFIILIIRATVRQRERRALYEKNALFKAALAANSFAVRLDIKNGVRTYSYYYSSKQSRGDDPSINISAVNEKDIFDFKTRIYSDDLIAFEHIMSDSNISYVIASGRPDYNVIRILSGDGEYEYTSITLQSMELFDGQEHVLAFFKNINENKRREEERIKTLSLALETAKKYSESKSLFLSQMSHDIRTPMNAIAGMSQLAMLNIDNKEKLEECLETINNSSDHLISLLSDVLDMSKIEKGIFAFSNRTINILDSFEKAVSIHSGNIIKKHIVLKIDKDEIKHVNVYTDAARLEQVFSNVISNACKYTNPGGEIDITLLEGKPNEDTNFYEFIVTDTGIGMNEEMLSNIYSPFERAKEVEFLDGSGLGMSITKNIVDAMGGVIDITSTEGEGTTVKVTLPFKEKAKEFEETGPAKAEKKKKLTVTGKGKNALIVEDVEINAMFASAITEMKGFKADICENGLEAVKVLEASLDGYYSIVLMDIQMPVMNGYDATLKIRASERDYLKNIPIIAMSANAFEEDIIKCKNVGMNDHISKPVDINRFSEIVDLYVKE